MRLISVLIVVLLLTAACRQSQQQSATQTAGGAIVQIEMTTEPSPPQTGEGTLLITVRDLDGTPADVTRVEVRGDMNHAGMQPVFGSADAATDSVYRVPFNWSMGGDWFIDVTVMLADGTTASQRFEASVVP